MCVYFENVQFSTLMSITDLLKWRIQLRINDMPVVVSFIRIRNNFDQKDKDFVNILYNVKPRLST